MFNNAAQHWNHSFYWQGMGPDGGGQPSGALAEAIDHDFGSYDAFRKELAEEAETHFASGWAWLVHDGSKLLVTSTHDADLPLKHSQRALLTIDVWEHAYYVDYRNRRPDYIAAFLDELVNWDFVARTSSVAAATSSDLRSACGPSSSLRTGEPVLRTGAPPRPAPRTPRRPPRNPPHRATSPRYAEVPDGTREQ